MSVLIKGLKMPMGCYECPFEVWGIWGKCMFINYNVSGTEPESCPLVEVPTPHGPLIDMNEALHTFSELEPYRRAFGKMVLIEAEEGEEQ